MSNPIDPSQLPIQLPSQAPISAYQHYIHALETQHGWLEVDLVHNCFLMGEEVGELFKAIRKHQKYFNEGSTQPQAPQTDTQTAVAEELVDVFNYLLALANRLDIDMEAAFRNKNARNQQRRWD
jgi:NTP pyrophosphatase (non-canonical NTP hydrolase)